MTAILIRIFLPRFARQYHRSAAQQDGFHLLIRHINAIRCRRSFIRVLVAASKPMTGFANSCHPGRRGRQGARHVAMRRPPARPLPECRRIDESFARQHLPSGICANDVR
jgi:hypothetical protein